MNKKQLEKLNRILGYCDKDLKHIIAIELDKNYRKNDRVHGIDHVLNTACLVSHISYSLTSKGYRCKYDILMYAALFHGIGHNKDFDDPNSGSKGAELVKDVFHNINNKFQSIRGSYFFSGDMINEIASCIARYNTIDVNDKGESLLTIEEKILSDADKLDLIGFSGLVRLIAFADQSKNRIRALQNMKKYCNRNIKLIPKLLYLPKSHEIFEKEMIITQQFMECF